MRISVHLKSKLVDEPMARRELRIAESAEGAGNYYMAGVHYSGAGMRARVMGMESDALKYLRRSSMYFEMAALAMAHGAESLSQGWHSAGNMEAHTINEIVTCLRHAAVSAEYSDLHRRYMDLKYAADTVEQHPELAGLLIAARK